jgi:hypothetical protein
MVFKKIAIIDDNGDKGIEYFNSRNDFETLLLTNKEDALNYINLKDSKRVDIWSVDCFIPENRNTIKTNLLGPDIAEVLESKDYAWALVSSKYHHGDELQSTCEWVRENKYPEIIDCDGKISKSDLKFWEGAYITHRDNLESVLYGSAARRLKSLGEESREGKDLDLLEEGINKLSNGKEFNYTNRDQGFLIQDYLFSNQRLLKKHGKKIILSNPSNFSSYCWKVSQKLPNEYGTKISYFLNLVDNDKDFLNKLAEEVNKNWDIKEFIEQINNHISSTNFKED